MTPQEIAKEAAEQFLADSFPTMSRFLTVEACHKARLDMVAALILSAAAKMVRESGLESALQQGIADMRFAHEAAEKKWNSEVLIATGVGGARLEKALTALRQLTEAK